MIVSITNFKEFVMKPHQQRVVDEKVALDDKIFKLEAFMESDASNVLSLTEEDDLEEQLRHMEKYSKVLERRISRFI